MLDSFELFELIGLRKFLGRRRMFFSQSFTIFTNMHLDLVFNVFVFYFLFFVFLTEVGYGTLTKVTSGGQTVKF